jgi:hypothetical protein
MGLLELNNSDIEIYNIYHNNYIAQYDYYIFIIPKMRTGTKSKISNTS